MSRVRERVIQQSSPRTYSLSLTETDTTTGEQLLTGGSPWTGSLSPAVLITQSTVDEVTPEFHARMQRGEIINNPFQTARIETYGPDPNSGIARNSSNYPTVVQGRAYDYTREFSGTQPYKGPVPYSLLNSNPPCDVATMRDNVKDLAVTNAHAKVNESEMLALATIAESGKTVDFLFTTLRKAVQVFKAVRKLDLRAAKDLLRPKEIEDMYMSYRYALRPLIYDVAGLTAALQSKRAANQRRTSRGWATDKAVGSDTIDNVALFSDTACSFTQAWSYGVSARAGVLCDVNIDALVSFGVTDMLETGWELLPFSFIADWFVNIGTTVAAWTPNMRAEQLASWVTVREVLETQVTPGAVTDLFVSDAYTTERVVSIVPGGYRGKESFLQRYVDPELSLFPTRTVRLDQFKILDLVIVLKNLMFGGKR